MPKKHDHERLLDELLVDILDTLHRQNHLLKELMIHQTDIDTAVTNLTAAVTTAIAALQAGSGTPSTPDTTVQTLLDNVNSQTARLDAATATAPGSLTITTQPGSMTVTAGTPVALNVAFSGGTAPYTFVWSKDGTALTNGNQSSFAIAAATSADAGSYTVAITDSSTPPVTVTSKAVVLTVQ